MFTTGVAVSAGVMVGDNCSFDYHLCGDQVEFEWGGRRGLYVVITEGGLRNLIATASEALNALQEDAADESPGAVAI